MSSGSKKKQTVGYWYKLLQHLGLCKGPIDALLQFRAGDRVAWKGVQSSNGRLSINQPNLWGGQKSEGGLVGDLDVMMGGSDQQANDYLAANLGAAQPTYRGKVSVVWRGGRWGAMNPYPKKPEFLVRRILKGWDNDAPWYPEKAEIGLISGRPLAVYFALDMSTSMFAETANGQSRMKNMQTAVGDALRFIRDVVVPAAGRVDVALVGWGDAPSTNVYKISRSVTPLSIDQLISWLDSQVPVFSTFFPAGLALMKPFFLDAPAGASQLVLFITDGVPYEVGFAPTQIAEAAAAMVAAQPGAVVHGINIGLTDTTYTAHVDNTPENGVPVIADSDPSALTAAIVGALRGALIGMNPVHILYDSLTAADMQREPVAMINDASFRSAADQCYAEGLGLCTTFDGGDVEAFQQRILDVIGGSMTQSRVDGLYYIDLIRGSAAAESMPVITADDIIDFSQESRVLTESVNQLVVEWFDPLEKQQRTTPPLQAMGAIQAAGGVISDTVDYPEIASESLALRLGARDLQSKVTPLSRFKLTINRRNLDLRPGRAIRLQYPAEGIADMVCILVEVDNGTLTNGRMRIVALQDVFTFAQTAYVQVEFGLAQPPAVVPEASLHQRLIEMPYAELVGNMSRADLAVLPTDVGLLLTAATRPAVGLNYAIHTAAEGEVFATFGGAEWCPTALVVEAASYLDTLFSVTGGTDLDNVTLGSWALWDDEIVRVDTLDAVAGTLTLGRGCADTVPTQHLAGSRIFFAGDWGGSDGREYVDGEVAKAKLLTRTSTQEQALADAQELSITLDQRQYRPYPPGQFKISGQAYPAIVEGVLTVTWAHRDRILQDDKLFSSTEASIGPEPGTTYIARLRLAADQSLLAESAVAGVTATLSPTAEGAVILELLSVRGGVESLQRHSHPFLYTASQFRVTEDGELRIDESGNYRVLEAT